MAIANKLTQKQLLQTDSPAVLNDGNGLYIRLRSTGRASWFCRIRHPQTKKLIDKVFGQFPDMSLREARCKIDKVKIEILSLCFKQESTHQMLGFQDYAESYIDRKEAEWRNPKTQTTMAEYVKRLRLSSHWIAQH